MPSVTTRGVVVRLVNYRDHDRMLTLLSPQLGRVDALSRGCRRPRSALLAASELFVSGEFVLCDSREHGALTACQIDDTFYPLRLEPYRLTCASYMASLCAAAAQPGQEARQLYELLLRGLYYLAYDPQADPLETTTAFLLLLADVSGYRPRLSRCASCRTPLDVGAGALWDGAAGGLCCPACRTRESARLSQEQIAWMCGVLRGGLTPQKNTGAGSMFDLLRRYVEDRLETPVRAGRLLP